RSRSATAWPSSTPAARWWASRRSRPTRAPTTPSPACTSTTARPPTTPPSSSPRPAASWRSPTSTSATWTRARCTWSSWAAATPGWTPAPTSRCTMPPTSSRPSRTAKACRCAARRRSPTATAGSTRRSWRSWRSRWPRTATASTCWPCSSAGWCDEGDRDRPAGLRGDRAGGVRRRPRRVLRDLERRALRPARPADPVRAEQRVHLHPRRAARPALPVAAAAGQAGERAGRRGLRRGGGHPPWLADLRPLGSGGAQCAEPAPVLDPGGLRPRLRGAVRARDLQLPVHRRVREGVRRRGAPERRRQRRGAAHRRAGAVGQGQQRAVPGREPRGPPAGVRAMTRLLLVGGKGQLGRELRRSLAPLGELVVATRDGRLHDGGSAIAADLADPQHLAGVVREVAPDAVINAAA